MKILYAIQGTGNGHISRARCFIPKLQQGADVDVLLSGSSSDLPLPTEVTYRFPGLGYTFGKNGGINYFKSIANMKAIRFIRDVNRIPMDQYDLVISDFEPVSAWAAQKSGVISVGLSHQAAFISDNVPRPIKRSLLGEAILRYYAPCNYVIGFHYQEYDDFIFPPVIHEDVRMLSVKTSDSLKKSGAAMRISVTVYLPAYSEQVLIPYFEQLPDVEWHLFTKEATTTSTRRNVHIHPIARQSYLDSLSRSSGVICGAGFEAPSEALYLRKSLLVIPMKQQYEQQCNAAALERMGVTVCPVIDQSFVRILRQWLKQSRPLNVFLPDRTNDIVDLLFHMAGKQDRQTPDVSIRAKLAGERSSTIQPVTSKRPA